MYEEGTWTPVASAYGGTETIANCHYRRIGKMVFISGMVSGDGTSDTSNVVITGLPFTSQDTTNDVWGGFVTYSQGNLDRNLQIIISSDGTQFLVADGAGTQVTYNDIGFNTSKGIRFVLTMSV